MLVLGSGFLASTSRSLRQNLSRIVVKKNSARIEVSDLWGKTVYRALTSRWNGTARLEADYLGWATLVPNWPSGEGIRILSVRNYTTKRIADGTMFICIRCKYQVTTLDFHKEAGNLRTQAATAINLHAAAVHGQPMLVSAPASQRRI